MTHPSAISANPDRSPRKGLSKSFPRIWHDLKKNRYVSACPECGHLVSSAGFEALYRELGRGENPACQGCRAKRCFEKNPGLIGFYLNFWYQTGAYPESPSWLEAIPPHQAAFWNKEIRTFFETAPG